MDRGIPARERYPGEEDRAERLAALANLTALIASTRESREVFRAIVESAVTLVGAKLARLWVNDPRSRVLRVEASVGLSARIEERVGAVDSLAYGQGIVGRVFVSRTPEYVLDVQEDPRWWSRELAREAGLRGSAFIPLVAKDVAVGVLVVLCDTRRAFTPEEKELMNLLADHAAIAIRNAGLYAEAVRRAREAEVMAEITRTVTASLDLDTVLQRVTAAARALCQSDLAWLALRDARSGAMVLRYWPGARGEGYDAIRIEPGKGIGGQVLLSGRPFRTENYRADPRITRDYVAVAEVEDVVTAMAVPIESEGRVDGLFYVENRSPRPFTDEDEAVLLRLADHAAVAIRNARLFAGEEEARAAAETSGQRLRDLVQTLDAIVWEADVAAEEEWEDMSPRLFTFVSRRAEVLLGYPVDRWVAEPAFWASVIHPDDRARVARACQAAVTVGRDFELHYRAVAADGHVVWLRDLVGIVRDGAGRTVQLRGLMVDITERKQVEAALGESEERFRHLAENAQDVIYRYRLIPPPGFEYVSPAATTVTGYTPAEHYADPDFALKIVHPDDRALLGALRTSTGAFYKPLVLRWVRKDGEVIWAELRNVPIRDEAGRVVALEGIARDISERMRVAQLRQQLLNQALMAQEEERARIARELHDETGQSLVSLVVGLNALANARTLKAAKTQAGQLRRLASLAVSEVRRLARGLRPSVLDDLGLAAALERYAAEYARSRGIRVNVDARSLDERLPSRVETALYRIAQEALTNVGKHAEAKAVTIALERRPSSAQLIVGDDGRGFDVAAVLGRTGAAEHFGLHGMRERAALLGGSVTIEAAAGKGTVIVVEIPL